MWKLTLTYDFGDIEYYIDKSVKDNWQEKLQEASIKLIEGYSSVLHASDGALIIDQRFVGFHFEEVDEEEEVKDES